MKTVGSLSMMCRNMLGPATLAVVSLLWILPHALAQDRPSSSVEGRAMILSQSPPPLGINPSTPVITAFCNAQYCQLVTTNGNPTQVKTLFNVGMKDFWLSCRDANNNKVGNDSQYLTPGFGIQGMSCPSNAVYLTLVCPEPNCTLAYVP